MQVQLVQLSEHFAMHRASVWIGYLSLCLSWQCFLLGLGRAVSCGHQKRDAGKQKLA